MIKNTVIWCNQTVLKLPTLQSRQPWQTARRRSRTPYSRPSTPQLHDECSFTQTCHCTVILNQYIFFKSYFSQLHILFVNLSAKHFNFEDNEQTTVFSQCHSYVIFSQKFEHDIIESKLYFLLFGSGKKNRQLTYEWKFQINYST